MIDLNKFKHFFFIRSERKSIMEQFLAHFEDSEYIKFIVAISGAALISFTFMIFLIYYYNQITKKKLTFKSLSNYILTLILVPLVVSFLLTHYHYKDHKYADDTIISIQENYYISHNDNEITFKLKNNNSYYKNSLEFDVKKTLETDKYILTDKTNQSYYFTLTSEDLKNITTPNYKDNKEEKDRKLNVINSTIKSMFGI